MYITRDFRDQRPVISDQRPETRDQEKTANFKTFANYSANHNEKTAKRHMYILLPGELHELTENENWRLETKDQRLETRENSNFKTTANHSALHNKTTANDIYIFYSSGESHESTETRDQ